MQTVLSSRLLLAVGVVYATLAVQRLALWRSGEIALWHDAAVQSQGPRPWVQLGNLYRVAGRVDEADYAYVIAIEHAEAYRSGFEGIVGGAVARANRGILYREACGNGLLLDDSSGYEHFITRCAQGLNFIAQAHSLWPSSKELGALDASERKR